MKEVQLPILTILYLFSHSFEIFRHRTNTTYWRTLDTQGWTNEMQGIREMISKFAHIDESEIIGKLFLAITFYYVSTCHLAFHHNKILLNRYPSTILTRWRR